ncbi:hypothetical protein MHY_25730 [Megamonas hypermegale ART12/1]|nr:hypothetical protein MHY_25730 [Megamonas hypermegale ART12/1]
MRIIERKGKMSNIKLLTRNFITLVGANGLLFAGFHFYYLLYHYMLHQLELVVQKLEL